MPMSRREEVLLAKALAKEFRLPTSDAFRRAEVKEYAHWLSLWVENGGELGHLYSYPFERVNLLVPLEPFELYGEKGASSRDFLVYERSYFLGGEVAHNELFFFDDPMHIGSFDRAHVYSDPEFRGLNAELDRFIETAKKT